MLSLTAMMALSTAPPTALKLPTFLSSSMALQREPLAARLWGWAPPGSKVSATLDAANPFGAGRATATATTTTADTGGWIIDLPPQPAGTGHKIVISDGHTNITLDDIAFGDVYLCSGQSNMQFSVNDAFNSTAEIAASIDFADVRLATVALQVANAPQDDAKHAANYTWARASPAAFVPAGGKGFTWFSATCWFFGRDLYTALDRKVPIGLIASDWGGQRVECFSSPDALADTTCGGTVPSTRRLAEVEATEVEATEATEEEVYDDWGGPTPNPGPTQLWNAMIYPLLNMRFTGAVWYQGEANAGDPSGYACRFPAMIADWRVKFNLPDLSFFYVQLAAFKQDFSLIRAAQGAALQLPQVGLAVAIDLGDPTSPRGSIHPRRKQEVGRRLALSTQAIQYGMADVVHTGPVPSGAVKLIPTGAVIGFVPGTASNLNLNGTGACTSCCDDSAFSVMLADGSWAKAPASIVSGNEVLLNAGKPILGIRLDWEGYPQCALYNGVGGPDSHTAIAASPFQWCAYGTVDGQPDWSASCAVHNRIDIYYPASQVPSTAKMDFTFAGGAGFAPLAREDAMCSGTNMRSGNPGGIGYISSKHALVGSGHKIDRITMAFRYIAGYTPAKGAHKNASVVTVLLTDAKGAVLKTLMTTPPLGNYSYDVFTGFSPPIEVDKSGIGLKHDGKVYLTLKVVNNERNLQIPMDDLAGGWNVTVGWK